MPWELFSGTGRPRRTEESWRDLPEPPPWRRQGAGPVRLRLPDELIDAVNAALHLRRPLLLTGLPGSGKTTLVDLVAAELQLEPVLRWHITSKTVLADGLYQHDALGRLYASQVTEGPGAPPRGTQSERIDRYVALGPLGTALCSPRPRAVLIDEIDKSDIDLAGDLLNVLEAGEFEIPPLVRDARAIAEAGDGPVGSVTYRLRGADREFYRVDDGVVRAEHLPIIVFTSNGERTFPAPFLRRCIRFTMPKPTRGDQVLAMVSAHLADLGEDDRKVIDDFAARVKAGEVLAFDQLLNLLYLTGTAARDGRPRKDLKDLILAELSGP